MRDRRINPLMNCNNGLCDYFACRTFSGFPAPDGEAADGRHASGHARSPIYRAAAPRCLSKKALISPKASFVSGA
jgi:hypothetical protein